MGAEGSEIIRLFQDVSDALAIYLLQVGKCGILQLASQRVISSPGCSSAEVWSQSNLQPKMTLRHLHVSHRAEVPCSLLNVPGMLGNPPSCN